MNPTDRDIIGAALGRVASGLFIVTIRHEEQVSAFLASWVQQASFEPLMISVAVKEGRAAQGLLDAGALFAINVLAQGDNATLRHFAKGFAPDEDPYAGCEVETGATGVEILPGALAVLECRARSSIVAGDHRIYLGEVMAGHLKADGGAPAIHLRKSALSY